MNPLASISKSIREMEKAYGQCKTPESTKKAQDAIRMAVARMGVPELFVTLPKEVPFEEVGAPSVFLAVEGANVGGAVGSRVDGEKGVVGKESGSVGVVEEREVILTPVSDHEHEVGGVFGCDGVVEQKVVDVNEPPVDGWPVRGKIKVRGLFPNRRRLCGELEDGRVVAVERKPGVQTGSVVVGKIVLGGRPPLYRVVL